MLPIFSIQNTDNSRELGNGLYLVPYVEGRRVATGQAVQNNQVPYIHAGSDCPGNNTKYI